MYGFTVLSVLLFGFLRFNRVLLVFDCFMGFSSVSKAFKCFLV